MAADGSIVIEVEGDAQKLEKALKNVSTSAETLESSVKDIATAFRTVENAVSGIDGGGLDDVAKDADNLDAYLDDAAHAADRLDNALDDTGDSDLDGAARDADQLDGALDRAARAADSLDGELNSLDGVSSKISGGFTVMKGALASLAAEGIQMVLQGLGNLVGEAITAADSLTKFKSTMDFAGFGAAEIDALTQSVQDYASKTVYDLETVANTVAQLGANGVKDFMKLTEAAGNLNAVAGGNAETFKSVSMVLTQTAGAGKLTTENWNQLADAIPGASGVLQEAMKKNGAYTGDFRDAMAEGQITAEEFNQAIMDLGFEEAAVEAASSVSTIEGAFGNLKATVVDGLVAALTDGGLMAGITGFINGINSVLVGAGQYIGPAMESIKNSISGVKDAFSNAFTGEQQAAILDFLSTFASALVGLPFQIVAVGVEIVTTAFELLITAAGAVVEFFQGLPSISDIASSVSSAVSSAFESMRNAISTAVENAKTSVSNAWESVKSATSKTMESVKSAISKAWDAVKSTVSSVLDAIKSTVTSAWNAVKSTIASVMDAVKSTITNAWNAIKSTVTNAVNNVKSTVTSAFDNIKSTISNAMNAAKSTVSSIFDSIKNAISDKINAAANVVKSAVDKIKGAFNFSWSLPPLKLPHISVTGGVAPFGIGGKGSLPKFSIAWYAKGGVMKSPTIFGVAGNNLLGGGEAGPEAIAPISVLQKYIREAVSGSMSDFVGRLKRAVESETVSISSVLGSRVGESGGVSNHYGGGTTINVYVDGGADSPQKARNIGREIGAETAREMRRRGLVPA